MTQASSSDVDQSSETILISHQSIDTNSEAARAIKIEGDWTHYSTLLAPGQATREPKHVQLILKNSNPVKVSGGVLTLTTEPRA
jgi:hypothetical protein